MIIKTSPDVLEIFLKDASNTHGSAEILYLPENHIEVKTVLQECFKNDIPITISGGRTGLVAGALPNGGAIISTERLNTIISIDFKKQTAILQPGVLLKDFQQELLKEDYFYPPDPTETTASIGGTIATNASGARTYKYGATRNFVQSLKVILANGDELFLKRGENFAEGNLLKIISQSGKNYEMEIPDVKMPDIKHAAGYFLKSGMDAIDLFIGSEGTLGIIAEIEVKFLKAPEQVIGGVIFFTKDEDVLPLLQFLKPFKNENLQPRLLEFFDERSIALLKESFKNIPENAGAALWFEQETTFENFDEVLQIWAETIGEFTELADETWIALDKTEHVRIKNFRHALPSAVYERISMNDQKKIGTDMAVPDAAFGELFEFYKSELKRESLDYVMFGHIGNNHLHVNIFAQGEEEFLKAQEFYARCIDKSLKLGGTISAEHGVGKLKTEFLKRMYGEEVLKSMFEIKKTFDEKLLLGRGTMFAEIF
ncbi:MAG: FAD-binding oxidoreductase [Bacteroidota bacterium]